MNLGGKLGLVAVGPAPQAFERWFRTRLVRFLVLIPSEGFRYTKFRGGGEWGPKFRAPPGPFRCAND